MTGRLIITGTRHGRPDAEDWLNLFVAYREVPTQFICGGLRRKQPQKGVDEQAYRWAMGRLDQRTIVREFVRDDLPSPECFHERDARMAAHVVGPGDFCLALPDDRSSGTWLTLRMCQERGASWFVCPIWPANSLPPAAADVLQRRP